MIRRAAERRVLPDSPRRVPPDIEFEEASHDFQHMHAGVYPQQQDHSQYRSPTGQQYVGQMQRHPHPNQMSGMAYGPMPQEAYAGSMMYPQAGGWYDPYAEMQPWGNMDLNAGAVMVNGMEALMIPVG